MNRNRGNGMSKGVDLMFVQYERRVLLENVTYHLYLDHDRSIFEFIINDRRSILIQDKQPILHLSSFRNGAQI